MQVLREVGPESRGTRGEAANGGSKMLQQGIEQASLQIIYHLLHVLPWP